MVLKLYYWPMLARGAAPLRMLDYSGIAYEYISNRDEFSKLASLMGGAGDTLAVPIIDDDGFIISQSTACTMYLGKKLGLCPDGFNDFKAYQYLVDIVDTFEGGLGKNNEQGPTLKKYLEGDRWPKLVGNIERSIKGPFYFGDKPSCVDFFLCAHLDHRTSQVFKPLKEKYGFDVMASYPKALGVQTAIQALPGYDKATLKPPGPIKDEVLNSYNS